MLTCPSVHPAYPKMHFRIMRTVNPLSKLYINLKFQKYISVSIQHFLRASFMRSLFIAFKNDEWYHFVVRISSPAFFFILLRVSFLSISLFFLFMESTTCCGFEVEQYLKESSEVVRRFLSGVLRSGLLQPLVINITGLINFEKN